MAALDGHRLDQGGHRRIAGALVEWAAAGEHLIEDHAQAVKIGAMVDLPDQGRVAGGEGAQMLGRHVGHGAAQRRHRLGLPPGKVLRQVEIQEHRLAVGAQEDVGRLDIAMEHAAFVGMLQGVGQQTCQPGRGADIAALAQVCQEVGAGILGRGGRNRVVCRGLGCRNCRIADGGKGLRQFLALDRKMVLGPEDFQHPRQAGAAKVRHAHDAHARGGVLVRGIDRHDVRVLKLGQRLRLVAVDGRDLDDDRPPRQGGLLGQKDPREGAAPKLLAKVEAQHLLARLRQ